MLKRDLNKSRDSSVKESKLKVLELFKQGRQPKEFKKITQKRRICKNYYLSLYYINHSTELSFLSM